MERGLYSFLLSSLSYLIIFLLSTSVPILIYRKTNWWCVGISFISVLLTILFINIYSHVGYYFRWPIHPAFQEFYEVFWLIPPIVVYFYCRFLERKKNDRNKIH